MVDNSANRLFQDDSDSDEFEGFDNSEIAALARRMKAMPTQ